MSTPKINPNLNPSLASKSLYEEKAEEFIKRKNPLGAKRSEATAAPVTQLQQDTDVGGCAVIESLSSALRGVFGVFQGRPEITPLGEVVVDSRELTKDLEVAEEISPQMFGLILDDHAIGDTTFEGAHLSTTIDYMGSVLVKNKNRVESLGLDVDGFIRKFAFPAAVAHDLETLFLGKRDLNGQEQEAVLKQLKKIGDHISEAIQNLALGESLLLPGGWSPRKKSGHAILYEVTRDEKGTYSFAVYNTGQGLKNHPSVLHDSKQKFQGYIEIEGIAYDKITSANFYKTLFELRYFNRVKLDTQTETKGPDEVYGGLLTSLGGNEKKFHPGHLGYRSSQRSGTCAWKCLMEALR
jgi:hypothetical protein